MSDNLENSRNLILGLSHALGIKPVMLNEDNSARLIFDENIAIDFEANPDQNILYMIAPVCPLPEKSDPLFFQRMLEENLDLWSQSRTGFAIDKELEEIVLISAFQPDGTNLAEFQEALSLFIGLAEKYIDASSKGGFLNPEAGKENVKASDDNAGAGVSFRV